MICCRLTPDETNRFFSWFARLSRKHYQKRGLSKTQQRLMDGVKSLGYEGARVLDIGCGVGFLHQKLLQDGAATAVGVDLSERMLVEAESSAREAALAERVDYRQGDFVEMADNIPESDITVLDKVVCCYPNPEMLVGKSLEKTRRIYALTYPRRHLLNRLLMEVQAVFMRVIRCGFRPYVHDPDAIESWIIAQGFEKRMQHRSLIWITQVYAR